MKSNPNSARRIAALGCLAGLALLLGACAGTPFVDGRREAGQKEPVGASTPDRVAVCYSSRGTTPREVLALAQAECAKTNRRAQFDGQDEFRCSLLAPTRAYFKCVGP
ncbi:MAG: hypothetical protein SFV19_07765 [Rhodospirillaceae bacterium]|nr:hypothetical protein [Rhodospirillaceae bacterium]